MDWPRPEKGPPLTETKNAPLKVSPIIPVALVEALKTTEYSISSMPAWSVRNFPLETINLDLLNPLQLGTPTMLK